jgi:hypothetical protein
VAKRVYHLLQPDTIGAECTPSVLMRQIGAGNVLAISGGRFGVIANRDRVVGVNLPVGAGYSVEIILAPDDTYTVKRVFTRKSRFVKGVRRGVYAEDIGEAAYQASCYVNVDFGQED